MTSITKHSVWDLGEYKLSNVNSSKKVGQILDRFELEFDIYGRTGYYELRMPNYHHGEAKWDHSVHNWHRDGPTTRHYMVIWSNVNPTQLSKRSDLILPIKDFDECYYNKTSQIYTLDVGHMYIINNERWWHRSPPNIYYKNAPKRYFMRMRLAAPGKGTPRNGFQKEPPRHGQ